MRSSDKIDVRPFHHQQVVEYLLTGECPTGFRHQVMVVDTAQLYGFPIQPENRSVDFDFPDAHFLIDTLYYVAIIQQ